MENLALILLILCASFSIKGWAQTQTYSMDGYPTTTSTYAKDGNGNMVVISTVACDGTRNVDCFNLTCSCDLPFSKSKESFDMLLEQEATLSYYKEGTKIIESGLLKRFKGDFFTHTSSFVIEMIKR